MILRELYKLPNAELLSKIDTIFGDKLTTEERSVYTSDFVTNATIERISVGREEMMIKMYYPNEEENQVNRVKIDKNGIYINPNSNLRLKFNFKDPEFVTYFNSL